MFQILSQLLRDDDNKYCCDCDQKGPRWASWNLGIFLCIRCAGIHRNLGESKNDASQPEVLFNLNFQFDICILGVHISRVKSVNLDTWAPEQVVSLQQMGNSRARAVYEALLSDNFRRPQTDSGLESFIRAKYEHKKYIAREWIPPPPITKVDWDREIEEEIENQKRKKKTSSSSNPIVEHVKSAPSPINVPIPAPLPKPHSPKNSRLEAKKTAVMSSNSMDLLGLNTSVPSSASPALIDGSKAATTSDSFDFFANVTEIPVNFPAQQNSNETVKDNPVMNSLKQEEDDFFNQKSIDAGSGDKRKMTKDSILALYGNTTSFTATPIQQGSNANYQQYPGVPQEQLFTYGQQPGAPLFKPIPFHQQQQPPSFTTNGPTMYNNGNFGNFNANFSTMQTQQINKLNEENIKKIESLNFNGFK